MTLNISVALCTYNGAAYIEEQLLSILGQCLRPDEIVVSDDGSTDGTLTFLERVLAAWRAEDAAHVVELVVLRNATALGVTANFEQAVAACTGDLIALCDQDDVWWPERLERMVAEFTRRPALLMMHADARLVDAAGAPLGFTLLQTLGVSTADRAAVHAGHAIDAYLRRNIVTGATMMVRRELVEQALPFPAAWVHDEWMAMVAAATGLVDLLEDQLTDYRQHGGNQIGVTSLDASGKLGRLRAPRTARNARLLARAAALQERASGFEPAASASVLALIDAKLAHEARRSALPAARLLRVGPIVRGWRAGDYCRFGLGLQDVLRDLVQPV
ncbi:Glycosyltransferase involved in cell wall bisynthesis [Cryobacterium flavum]|uniref:Glycosyltransferase family 2 protein n=1 Tax=Cryobacterium flavum TaxID=1424659 RepID=A0A4R8VED4_9MICO|nr:glycosyltransferase family 2 protein [Cryobacterium flavum]TFB81429.1 glycosyltransferase family 2 protein [Cryobacterium flavum]SDO40392.1 Glycosyltransferase involved in cell wall bisynthesis [Cryobacterium flavum]